MNYKLLALTLASLISFNANSQTGYDYFDGNNISALISPVGNHFWDFSTNHYNVPKDSATSTIFAFSTWLGGMNNGQLYLAAERFRSSGYDYLPGPIGDQSTYEPSEYAAWDRVWKITRSEVEAWINDPANVAVPQVVLDWPAHGDTTVGQSYMLAPFHDADNDGVYDPTNDLDYPIFKGDQAVYFIFHDGWIHTESGGQSINAEIHGMAYGFDCPEDSALNHTLFMEYNIINRSDNNYEDFYFGAWTDFDLGNAQDDYIGSDPMRNLFFAYQGDDEDEDAGGHEGFWNNMPAQGIRIIDGIAMDDDNADNLPSVEEFGNYNGFGMNDGTVDNEKLGLSSFLYHNNAAGPIGDPSIATDYYRFMQHQWKDGTPTTFGGNGFDPFNTKAIPARFMFPDSSDTNFYSTYGVDTMSNPYWDEISAGNLKGDRRGVGSTGPFSMDAGSTKSITLAFVFAQKMNDRTGAVLKMKDYSDQVQAFYNSGTTPCGDFDNDFTIGTEEAARETIKVFPNPTSDNVTITGINGSSSIEVISLDGKILLTQTASNTTSVELNTLSSGTYILKVTAQSGIFYESIVKM